MKIAFYKASGTFIDKIIRLITLGKYSHCELVFSDGRWFSACAWDNICRYKEGSLFNPNNWDFLEFDYDEELARMFCNGVEGAKYDFKAIMSFIFPDMREDRLKWYCSEVCHESLGFNRDKISPSDLHKKLVDINLKKRILN